MDVVINRLILLGADPNFTPFADFIRQELGEPVGDWLMVSPIHWEVSHNDAMIVAYGEQLGLGEDLAHVWFGEISEFLAHDGFRLIEYSPYCWLMQYPENNQFPVLHSPNIEKMNHQSMMPILGNLDDQQRWSRLLTEMQMFLSSHPLNASKNLKMTLNGVWFWGSGQLSIQIRPQPWYRRYLMEIRNLWS